MSVDETGAPGAGEVDEPVEEVPAASVAPAHSPEARDGDVDHRRSSTWRIDEAKRRRLRPWAIVGGVLVVLVTGGVALSYTSIFGARVIEVEGEERLSPRRVMRLAGLELGSNVVHLDTTSTEARLETDPWILDASVETRLPGTITISVRERRPVLVLAADGDRSLVAGDGTVLGHAPWAIELPEATAAPGATLDEATLGIAGEVVQAMAPTLRSSVDTVTLAADGTVSLIVDGDVEVRFGSVAEAAAKGRALRAIIAYAHEQDRGLLSVDVSSPAAPTARFVGSQQPTSVPDPSAAAASEGRAADDGADASPSPSPSPSR